MDSIILYRNGSNVTAPYLDTVFPVYRNGIVADIASLTTTATGSISYTFRGANGSTFVLDWGHGSPEIVTLLGTGTYVTKSHDYLGTTGTKQITFRQGVLNITYLDVPHTTATGGDLSNLSGMAGLKNLYLHSTAVTGNLLSLSGMTGLIYLYLYSTAVTGNLSSLSAMTLLAQLYLSSTAVTGNLSSLSAMASLTQLFVNLTTVTGNLESLASNNLDYIYTYFSGVTYADGGLRAWGNIDARHYSSGWTSAMVDNYLIDANDAGWASCIISIAGTNAARTSASAAALAALVSRGCTVTVNE